jgi:hypothetical protein
VDGNDGGQGFFGAIGVIYIQQTPFSVAAIGNIAAFRNSQGQGDIFIPLVVGNGGADVHHNGLKRHTHSSLNLPVLYHAAGKDM